MHFYYYTKLFLVLQIIIWETTSGQLNSKCSTPNNRRGQCIDIRKCPELYELLQGPRPLAQSVTNFLRQSNCGFQGRNPLVCCPNNEYQSHENNQYGTSTSVQDVRNHPRLKSLLPNNCGRLNENNKITFGDVASLFEFPWMARLGYLTNNKIVYSCAGTIINQRYILTAGHCLTGSKKSVLTTVRLGEYDVETETDCQEICAPHVQDIDIEEIIQHERYMKYTNDIGLIRLKWNINFNDAVQPICLPIGAIEQSNNLEGRKATVTGWGKTEHDVDSRLLLKVSLPIVPLSECSRKYESSSARITSQHFCAGLGDKDSCSGDSGGPLQFLTQRAKDLVYIQYGIVSFGPRRCWNSSMPGVYSRVGYFMQWILDNMRE